MLVNVDASLSDDRSEQRLGRHACMRTGLERTPMSRRRRAHESSKQFLQDLGRVLRPEDSTAFRSRANGNQNDGITYAAFTLQAR